MRKALKNGSHWFPDGNQSLFENKMSRPEHVAPPEVFYSAKEATKYANSSRMQEIQGLISARAIELLNLPADAKGLMLLDIGCGTGLSGGVIEEHGHNWIGIDISRNMLDIAAQELEDGDVVERDMGSGLGFRPGVFDGAISISAVQWLCYSSHKDQVPNIRLKRFFQDLYASLRKGARAVFQLYPETPQQMELITNAAMVCGFTGGVVIDYPNSAKAKKFYLVLFAGSSGTLPKARETEERATIHGRSTVSFESDRRGFRSKKRNRRDVPKTKTKEWILEKKERQRRQGKQVRSSSKYSGRKRSGKF